MQVKEEVSNDYGDGYSTPPIHPLDIYMLLFVGAFSTPLIGISLWVGQMMVGK